MEVYAKYIEYSGNNKDTAFGGAKFLICLPSGICKTWAAMLGHDVKSQSPLSVPSQSAGEWHQRGSPILRWALGHPLRHHRCGVLVLS